MSAFHTFISYNILMSSVEFINKDNLRIARENMGLDAVTASKKISQSKRDLVVEWESGESLPTWSQVEKLGKLYNVPELIFLSKETIHKNKIIPDYRVGISDGGDQNVKKLINLVITRQKWLEKFLKSEGYSRNQLQGSGKNLGTAKQLANFISEKLDIDLGKMKSLSRRKDALNYLIGKAEKKGIFVGKTISYHKLEVDDLRGLFISNDYCPFIVLNRRDALSAQIFSFIHELAHFFRRSDAVSNSLDFRSTGRGASPEEIFCNKVAAELLLPSQEFSSNSYNKADIDNISELYKVSKIFVFYRLKELGKIDRDMADDLENQIEREMNENLRAKAEMEKKEGGNYTNAMKDSNGSLFNKTIHSSYLENKIGYVEAANLLRFSPENA